MLLAVCRMQHVACLCCIPHETAGGVTGAASLGSMLHVVCCTRCMLYVACGMLYAVTCMLQTRSCIRYPAWCQLTAVCCMLHALRQTCMERRPARRRSMFEDFTRSHDIARGVTGAHFSKLHVACCLLYVVCTMFDAYAVFHTKPRGASQVRLL